MYGRFIYYRSIVAGVQASLDGCRLALRSNLLRGVIRRNILLQGRFQRFHIWTAAPHIADLLQRRQLGQRIQTQVIEELLGRAQQGRAADDVAITDGVDPAAVFQHLDRLRIDGNAAYFLDVAARHRLPVGDDGQRFQRRARVAARLFRVQPVEIHFHFRPALEAPARRQTDHFDTLADPVATQFFQQLLDGIGADAVAARPALVVDLDKQLFQAVYRQRLMRA